MSDPKTRRSAWKKKHGAVTTVKRDKRPIRTVGVQDALVFPVDPTDKAPLSDHPLPAGRSIRFGYRVYNKDRSIGQESTFAYPLDPPFEIPFARADYDAIETVDVWPIPYGHAAIHSTQGWGANYGFGRLTYEIPPIPPKPERGILSFRVMESVVGFIVGEMNRNKHSDVISYCHRMNVEAVDLEKQAEVMRKSSLPIPGGGLGPWLVLEAEAKAKRVAALGAFYEVEKTGGIWDHKGPIGKIWGEKNRLGDSEDIYFYDIWSNIHFGYVGHAAAFSFGTLSMGSSIQNFIDHFRDDEDADQGSARGGFDLYRAGRDVTIDDVLALVAAHPKWRLSERQK